MPPKKKMNASHRSVLAAVTLSAVDTARLLDGTSSTSSFIEGPQPAGLLAVVARLTHRPHLGPQENAGRLVSGLLKVAAAAEAAVVAALALAAFSCRLTTYPQDKQNTRPLELVAIEASLADLGSALRRQDVVAYATALEEDCVPIVVFGVMALAMVFPTPYETVLSHLHPVLLQCLRSRMIHEGEPSQCSAVHAESAARLALSATATGELPDGCEEALLALTQRCTEGITATLAAQSASVAAGGDAALHAAIAEVAGGRRFEVGGWKSAWAAPLATALRALAPSRSKPQRCTSSAAAAAAVVAGAEALIAHELSPLRGADDADQDIMAGILAPLVLAGAAAAPVQQQWQAKLCSALAEAAATLPPSRSDTSFTPAAAGAMLRLSALITVIFERCGDGRRCLLTDAGSPWQLFSDVLAAAFGRVTTLLTWQPTETHPAEQDVRRGAATAAAAAAAAIASAEGQKAEDALFLAALNLSQAVELVLAAVPAAGGLSALEEPPLPALLHSLSRLCRVSPEIIQRALVGEAADGKAAQELVIPQRVRRVTAVLEEAAGIILSAAEGRTAVLASDELLGPLAHSMSILVGKFAQDLRIQEWLDTQQPRAPAPPGSQPLEALQRAAGLCGRLLRAFGRRGARLLDCHGVAGGLATSLALMAGKGLLGVPLRSVCAALAALLRVSDEAKRQLTGSAKRESVWAAVVAGVRQALQQQPKARRQLCERALQEVEAALVQAPAAAGSSSPAASGGRADAASAKTAASADEAMRALLAEEAAAAPKPSKAAQKRARKKAAAAAAATPVSAAAAPAVRAEGLPAAGLPPPAAAAAPETAGAAASSSANADDGAAPVCSAGPEAAPQQRIITASREPGRIDAGDAAGGLGGLSLADGAPEADDQWMLCPISKVIMADPVVCVGDGQTYDRRAITAWLETHATSPVGGQPLASRDLIPNFALRSMIQAVQGGC